MGSSDNTNESKLENTPTDGISAVKFAPTSSQFLLASSWNCTVGLYDVVENTQWFKYSHSAPVLDCCFSDKQSFGEISDHMTLLVTLENGDQYLTDVGWGGSCFALPLRMKIGLIQSQPNGVYRLGKERGLITVEKKGQRYLKIEEDIIQFENEEQRSTVLGNDGGEEEWNIQFGFTEVGCEFSDFQEGHNYAQFQNEFMVSNMFAVLQNEKGRKFLFNNLYYEKEYVNPETIKLKTFKQCSIAEIYEILEREFGLKLEFELKLKKFIQ